ncbi:MAG: YggT family protein [Gemmatimonadales bacterium]
MFAAFILAVLVAIGAWLVRTRNVSPFSAVGRALRQATDPLLRPVERRVVRAGGSPANAGWWLVIAVAVLGILVVSLAQWLADAGHSILGAAHRGGGALIELAVLIVFDLLFFAIFVRVIASWFGAFRYSRWMRPVYRLTDWIIEPIRRMLPPMGVIDLSPIVALVLLYLLKRFVFEVLM